MNKEARLLSYIVVEDSGYAPNPWWEKCTLAVCKPVVRKTANVGDWIVGLTPRRLGYGLTYAMQVSEIMTLGEYFKEDRYRSKKPDFESNDLRMWMGDNFHEEKSGKFIQHVSAHNIYGRGKEKLEEKLKRDLSGINVLIADLFFYYGASALELPKSLDFLHVGRGHKVLGVKEILTFEKIAKNLLNNPGVLGEPRDLSKEAKKLMYLNQSPSRPSEE